MTGLTPRVLPWRHPMRHLVLTPDRNTGIDNDFTGAFDPEAIRYQRFYESLGDEVVRERVNVGVGTSARRAQTIRLIRAAVPFSRFAVFCHGWNDGIPSGLDDGIQFGFTRGPTVEALARELAASSTPALKVALYACLTASSDGPRGDGGEGGFADTLRDLLATLGRPEATVFGHTSAGHTTRNPQCRMFLPGCELGGVRLAETGSPAYEKLRRRLNAEADPLRWRLPYLSLEEIRAELA